jgi:hypothetical protein
LEECHVNDISFNPEKCVFCVNFGVLLGHIVCNERLLVDPRKLSTITTMPTPINTIEIKRFLGVACFYRQYFKDFASKTTPMCKLLKKNEEFKWDDAYNKSWEWMKASMTCLPILIVPNWNVEFHVHTNASNLALGVTLGKNPDNIIDKLIYYASRLMNNAETNYSTTKRNYWP